MLTALELAGFKSFADKTRFEFPAGITVIVGPNGSGKSNIVDAIKWVLGEQSAKSLRGQDMADVIFKGLPGTGRKPMNTAEATLVFDNGAGHLATSETEVRITRRVYRSGEGEYLINGGACRMKDVRDLFRGTGASSDAYAMIEQGRVDRLLASSSKDRRAIFEEAAGISRFKAKKQEAERRLERVDHNLLRLSDIVEEVGQRVRAIRTQAEKALRHRDLSARLERLRTGAARRNLARLDATLAQQTARIDSAQATISAARETETRLEAQQRDLDQTQAEQTRSRMEADQTLSDLRATLAGLAATTAAGRERLHRVTEERVNLWSEASTLHQRRRRLDAEKARLSERLGRTGADGSPEDRGDLEAEVRLRRANDAVAAVRGSIRADGERLLALLETTAQLRSQLASEEEKQARFEAESATAAREQTQHAATAEHHQTAATVVRREVDDLTESLGQAVRAVEAANVALGQGETDLEEARDALIVVERDAVVARERLRFLTADQTRDGATARTVIEAALVDRSRAGSTPGRSPLETLADRLTVSPGYGAAVDAVLGPLASAFMLKDRAEVDAVVHHADAWPGSGALTWDATTNDPDHGLADRRPNLPSADSPPSSSDADAAKGLVEPLTAYVELGDVPPPIRDRLARAFVALTVADALAAIETLPHGSIVVTRSGDRIGVGVIEFAGEAHALAGPVGRRQQRLEAEQAAQAASDAVRPAKALLATRTAEVGRLRTERDVAETARAKLDARLTEVKRRLAGLEHDRTVAEQAAADASARGGAARDQIPRQADVIATLRTRFAESQTELDALRQAQSQAETRIAEAEAERAAAERAITERRMAAARKEQQLATAREKADQLERESVELTRLEATLARRRADVNARIEAAERDVLRAEAEWSQRMLARDVLTATIRHHHQTAVTLDQTRLAIQRERSAALAARADAEATLHQATLDRQSAELTRQALLTRIEEEFGLDLQSVIAGPVGGDGPEPDSEPAPDSESKRTSSNGREPKAPVEPDERDDEVVEAEIARLRRQLASIGPVNPDSLVELDELEPRYQRLASQYEDLTTAKESLLRIINRIEADSRRLFVETLEQIRVNFQSLYRQCFGGGRADLLLEQSDDVLEAGIEIVANPPGKPEFSNSLLSGGEKALTAMALLLAIFQFRPSPFCILDEVDAPFDEANIGRFLGALRDFLGSTRFVIITHSKKTMTAATTLYGITMQESGVSKKVSVRFEDVSETGEIDPAALARSV